ncbi:MAG: 4'-phosphopantetheinyl transferase superfamily protein [Pseudomonadota bacterium]
MSATVLGLGVDLVDVVELHQLLAASDGAFVEAGWTPKELAQSARQSSRLAACWAAKEAAMKALGLGIGDIDPLDVEVDMSDQLRPLVHLFGQAEAARIDRGITSVVVKVAHDPQWAIATAVATGPGR